MGKKGMSYKERQEFQQRMNDHLYDNVFPHYFGNRARNRIRFSNPDKSDDVLNLNQNFFHEECLDIWVGLFKKLKKKFIK